MKKLTIFMFLITFSNIYSQAIGNINPRLKHYSNQYNRLFKTYTFTNEKSEPVNIWNEFSAKNKCNILLLYSAHPVLKSTYQFISQKIKITIDALKRINNNYSNSVQIIGIKYKTMEKSGWSSQETNYIMNDLTNQFFPIFNMNKKQYEKLLWNVVGARVTQVLMLTDKHFYITYGTIYMDDLILFNNEIEKVINK